VKGNFHARFWIGGGGSNPFADHTKVRIFAPIAVVSLEDLVPLTHFYRYLDHVLDLSFVRDLVKETYAGGGRPSIDPVVFWHRCNL
jgi:transposase